MDVTLGSASMNANCFLVSVCSVLRTQTSIVYGWLGRKVVAAPSSIHIPYELGLGASVGYVSGGSSHPNGRVATADGDAADVSGVEGLMHLHRCRALADCVIVGANTAIQDNPRLTVRLVKGDNPARVVIDPRGRLSEDAALLTGEGCLVVQACEQKRPAGVETIKVASSAEGLDAVSIVAGLIERGFRRIMIEGGGKTIGRFMDANLVDRLHVGISPLIIGAGPSGLTTNPVSLLAQAKRPRARVYGLGSDIIIDCDLKG